MKHFLLTRFNEYFPDAGPSYRIEDPHLGINEEWLKRRLKIFFQATFPTVKSQSNKNFIWIIKCHHKTPQWVKDELKNIEKEVNVIIDYEKFNLKEYKKNAIFNSLFECRFPSNRLICKFAFEKHIKIFNAESIITTRLDSDDAIAYDFIEKIQSNAKYNRFIDFHGAILSNGKIYKFRLHRTCRSRWESPRSSGQNASQFCSYKEKTNNKYKLKTVLFLDHTEANPCDYINEIGWLQINHNMCLNNHNVFPKKHIILENWNEKFKGIKNVVF